MLQSIFGTLSGRSFKLLISSLAIVILSGCPGDQATNPTPDSQNGALPPPVYGTNPSPIDTESNVLGPWYFKSTNFELTRTTTDFTIGNLQTGRYKLKVQNGNYGPFLARTCAAITDVAQRKQCLYDNLIERTTQEFTRTEKSLGSFNGVKLFAGKTLNRGFAYKEESVNVQANNQFVMDVQAFPTASLRMAIDYAEEFATPVALFSVNSLSGTAPATIKFNASHSYDADNADMASLQYFWDFGDGSTLTGTSATALNPSHVYAAAGTYIARLKVTDQTGRFDDFTAEIFVKAAGTPPPATNKNPVLKLVTTYPDPQNLRKVRVSLADSYDTDGVVSQYFIDFGSGVAAAKFTSQEAEYEYPKDGTYLLKVTITDDLGGKSSLTDSLSISTTNDLVNVAKIYGAQTYYGLLTERRITDTFTVQPQDVNALYKLTVKNADGLPHDQKSCSGITGAPLLSCQYDNLINKAYVNLERLDSVNVYLNGKLLTDSASINKTSYIFSTIVAPQEGVNTLEVRLKGNLTAYMQIEINKMEVASATPPILSLRSPRPEENFYSNQSPSNIQVVVDSNKVLQSGTIAGVVAKVVNGNILVATVPFPTAGRNNISVEATDLQGNTKTQGFGFDLIRDVVAPVITSSYANNSTTNKTVIDLPVVVVDSSPVTTSISLNGQELFLTGSKNFTTPITLPIEGENVITIQSIDVAGNASGVVSVRIIRDTIAPVLADLVPASNSFVDAVNFQVAGNSNEKLRSVTVNGEAAVVSADQMSFLFTYSEPQEKRVDLLIVATDLIGNISQVTVPITVILPVLNGSLLSVVPDPSNNKLIIKGAIQAVRPGLKVTASGSFFNSGNVIANANGTFEIALDPFENAEVKVTHPLSGRVERANVHFGPINDTVLSGIVRDSQNNPLSNATISISGTSLVTTTNNAGVFTFTKTETQGKVIYGDQTLIIEGSTIIDSTTGDPRIFSRTSIPITIGLNQTNVLQRPIYLTPVLLDNTEVPIDATVGGIVTNSTHAPGVEINIPANSAEFPDGFVQNDISIQTISSEFTSIEPIKSAMPKTVVALEPSGTTFSKPVQLKLPNTNEFPPKMDLVVLLMNSKTGKWEISGGAKVSDNGQDVVTKPGQGIRHFSLAYVAPLGPTVRQLGAQDKPGADTFNGSLSTSISLPSFKSLGESVSPSLTYKSSWAKPTAMITNIFELAVRKVDVTIPEQSGSGVQKVQVNVPYCSVWNNSPDKQVKCTDNYEEYMQDIQYKITYKDAQSTLTPDKIDATFQAANLVSPVMTFTGLPDQAVVSYGIEMKDPGAQAYFQSGIYPYISHYDLHFKDLTVATRRIEQKVNLGEPQVSEEAFTFDEIQRIFPEDLAENIYIQNYVNSSAGRGWRLNGVQKIVNPTQDKIMLEESSGGVSTYSISNTIDTMYDFSEVANLNQGVGLNNYPYVQFMDKDATKYKQINLLTPSSAPTNIGTPYTVSGTVAGYDYYNWTYVLVTPNWECLHHDWLTRCDQWGYKYYYSYYPKSHCARSSSNFTITSKPSQFIATNDGRVFGVDNGRSSVFEVAAGTATRIGGSLTAPPSFENFYVEQLGDVDSKISNFCQSTPGIQCVANTSYYEPQLDGSDQCGTAVIQSSGNIPDTSDLNSPLGISSGPRANTLVVADTGHHQVRLFDLLTNQSQIIAGTGSIGDSGDGAAATSANMFHPRGVIYDSLGNLYISTENGYIRKVDTLGIISHVAGDPVNGVVASSGDARELKLSQPYGMVIDSSRNYLYVADTGYNRVLRIDLATKQAVVVAGTGASGFSGDGGSAIDATLNSPTHLGLDDKGNLLIADSGNQRVRRVVFQSVQSGALAYSPTAEDNSKLTRNSDGTFTRTYRNGTKIFFNQEGLQTSSLDRVGRSTTYTYDSQKRLTEIKDPVGQRITYQYSGDTLSSITDPAGRTTSFMFSNKELIQVNYPDGTNKKFEYNAEGLMTAEVNERLAKTKYQYNDLNRLAKVIKADNTEIAINDSATQTSGNNFTGGTTGTLQKMDSTQASEAIKDARGATTKVTKDFMGYAYEITDAEGKVSKIKRDFKGRAIEIISADGTKVTNTYDQITGDLLTTTNVNLGITETKVYNQFGDVVSETNGKNQTTTKIYNPTTGLLMQENFPLGNYVAYQYNSYGLVTQKIIQNNGSNIFTTYSYNENGLVTQITDNDGKSSRNIYDLSGNVTQNIKTSNGLDQIITKFEFDTFNRLTKVTSPKNEITSYEYLPSGEFKKIVDPNNKEFIFEHDILGRVTKKIDQLGFFYQFSYDGNGNVTQEIDPNGSVKTFTYNLSNKITQANFPDDTISYIYNQKGKEISRANSVSKIEAEYDSRDRLTLSRTTGLGEMSSYPVVDLNYSYDLADNLASVSTVDYGSIVYTRDNNNRITNIENSWGDTFNIDYDLAGRVVQLSRPGGYSSFAYTQNGSLQEISHHAQSQIVDSVKFQYDQRNYITQKRTLAGNYNYSFDQNGQLIEATHPILPQENFQYDSLGNRIQDEARSYGFDSKGQRLLDDGIYIFQYDNNGNMTAKLPKDLINPKDAFKFTYSSKNQLIKTEVFAGTLGPKIKEISYIYDVAGRRMQKSVQDFANQLDTGKTYTRRYVYNGENIFLEFDSGSNLLARHTHFPEGVDNILSTQVTALGVTYKLAKTAGSYFYLKDHLGSITSILDNTGNIKQRFDYRSFGKIISITDNVGADISSDQNFKSSFTYGGRELEEESGLYYFRARFFDPTTGRFLQQDPEPGHIESPITVFNKYIYSGNNPIMFIDPMGRDFWDFVIGVFVIAAVIFTGGAAGALVGGAAGAAVGGGILGGIVGGIVGSAVGTIVGGAIGAATGALTYTWLGRDPQEGALKFGTLGALVGGFVGGVQGTRYGSDWHSAFIQDGMGTGSSNIANWPCAFALDVLGEFVGDLFYPEPFGSGGGQRLGNGELPVHLQPGMPPRLQPWEIPPRTPELRVPKDLSRPGQCPNPVSPTWAIRKAKTDVTS